MPWATMIASYGPEIVLSQTYLTLDYRLRLLSLLQPIVSVLQERFIRGCESIYSPEKAYEHTLLLTYKRFDVRSMNVFQSIEVYHFKFVIELIDYFRTRETIDD